MLTAEQTRRFLSNRTLHLVLMPTEQCNFRCTYCYEDFVLGEMPPTVVSGVKALIERRAPGLDLLSISWFGGEPLLAYRTLLDIQSRACELGSTYPDLEVSGAITTNGSLLHPERFRRLLDLGVRKYQIPIDGPQEAHDKMRVRLGGGGSFAVVWRHLLAMREVEDEFVVLVRVHSARENLSLLEEFIGDLAAHFGGDPRFRLSLRAVRRLGGPNDASIPVLDSEEEDSLEDLKARAAAANLTVHRGPFAAEGALQGCYAAAANSIVVRANGEIAKCTVVLDHPRNRVGFLAEDGTVRLDTGKMLGWMRGVFGDEEDLACPMRGWADRSTQGAMDRERPPLIRLAGLSAAGP